MSCPSASCSTSPRGAQPDPSSRMSFAEATRSARSPPIVASGSPSSPASTTSTRKAYCLKGNGSLPEGPTRADIQASIRRWADRYRIPRALALALAWQESGHQADVVSPAGAIGVMQVMPETWTYVESVLIGRPVPHTPDGNVRVGLAYLRHLLTCSATPSVLSLRTSRVTAPCEPMGSPRSTRRYVANILAIAGRVSDLPA